jgi:hypothetical protein
MQHICVQYLICFCSVDSITYDSVLLVSLMSNACLCVCLLNNTVRISLCREYTIWYRHYRLALSVLSACFDDVTHRGLTSACSVNCRSDDYRAIGVFGAWKPHGQP